MKIGSTSYQPSIFKAVNKSMNKEKEAVLNISEQLAPKQVIKTAVQRRIAEINEAKTNMGENNPKVQLIIEKFKSGKKLTAEEMNYIRKNAPGMVDYIENTMRERKILELSMKSAPTKMDVHNVAILALKQNEKHPNPEEAAIRANHIANALQEFEKTEEYKNKPNDIFEKREKEEQKQANNINYSSKLMMQAYDQRK